MSRSGFYFRPSRSSGKKKDNKTIITASRLYVHPKSLEGVFGSSVARDGRGLDLTSVDLPKTSNFQLTFLTNKSRAKPHQANDISPKNKEV